MEDAYGPASRELQDRFDNRRLADSSANTIRDFIRDQDKDFIEACDMLFLATVDESGNVNCSYKGGDPGFVRVLDEHTIAFPNYDGNGMFFSAGAILTTGQVGLLFIDFQAQRRMRLNGEASVDWHDPLMGEYPEAQFIIRVRATKVFPNCPRYIHKMSLVERSKFVPRVGCDTPIANWKLNRDPSVLSKSDQEKIAKLDQTSS